METHLYDDEGRYGFSRSRHKRGNAFNSAAVTHRRFDPSSNRFDDVKSGLLMYAPVHNLIKVLFGWRERGRNFLDGDKGIVGDKLCIENVRNVRGALFDTSVFVLRSHLPDLRYFEIVTARRMGI